MAKKSKITRRGYRRIQPWWPLEIILDKQIKSYIL